MRPSVLSRPVPFCAVVVLAVALDQVVKRIVEASLPYRELVPVMPMLGLYRTDNLGIAFSMLTGSSIWALMTLTVVVVGFVLYLRYRTGAGRWLAHLGYALIIGGALGNMLDRALLGHVVDYVLFHTGSWSFAVFNLADSFITVGAAAVILDELFGIGRAGGEGTDR